MHTLQTLRTFKTKNFKIVARAVEDTDLDLSWDEDGEALKGLQNGSLVSFGVIITVYYKGHEVGKDSLWSCIYPTYEKFMDHRECGKYNKELEAQGKPGRCGSYFSDMIHEAISEARKTLADRPYVRV